VKIERGQDGVISILQDASEGTPDASQDKRRRERTRKSNKLLHRNVLEA